jgi:hypothetical protein
LARDLLLLLRESLASTPMPLEDTDECAYDYHYEDGGSDRFASDSAFAGGAHTTFNMMTFDPKSCLYLHTKRVRGAQVMSNLSIGGTCARKELNRWRRSDLRVLETARVGCHDLRNHETKCETRLAVTGVTLVAGMVDVGTLPHI